MKHDPGTIEAKLFYHADPAEGFARLADALPKAFASTDISLTARLATDTDLAFAIGGLTLTVSRSNRALDVAALAEVNRPEATTTPMQEARRRLYRHRAAVAIRLTGPDWAAKPETRLGLCYIATRQVMELGKPDLIHWAGSNTLYTLEEFCTSTGCHMPIRPRPAVQIIPQRPARMAPDASISVPVFRRGSNTASTARPTAPFGTGALLLRNPLPRHAIG